MASTDFLHYAIEVEAFIASCKEGEATGLWRRTDAEDSKPVRTFYHGSAGIALYYLELHKATGDSAHLDQATLAGNELADYVESKDWLTVGFYSGWPGLVFVLNEIHKATGVERFKVSATTALEKLMAQASRIGAGIGWVEPMPFSDITGITGDRELIDLSVGAAGAGVIFLYAHREGLHVDALKWAEETADRLLEVSVQTDDGPNWLMMVDMPFSFTAPNFAHGAAGVAYFLADLYRESSKAVYLETAIAAAGYVRSRAEPQSAGHLVCHTEEAKPSSVFYLGVCHGPAGTGRLMFLLSEITGDSQWLDWLQGNMQGLMSTGAPEVRSSGLWNNYGQCCGDAGIGDYALSLYRKTGDGQYLDLAQRIARTAIENSQIVSGGRAWSQAEHRSRPEFVELQTGYMQGAAGLGSFLVHLATVDADDVAKIPLPETPF